MNKLYAIVKNIETGELSIKKGEYNTKKSFKDDLNANGFIVKDVYTLEQYFSLNYLDFKKDVFDKNIVNEIINKNNLEYEQFKERENVD